MMLNRWLALQCDCDLSLGHMRVRDTTHCVIVCADNGQGPLLLTLPPLRALPTNACSLGAQCPRTAGP
eukprot:scaffold3322_cov180-Isochrysis_galbana.AAC.1